jgi:hypothetical protein
VSAYGLEGYDGAPSPAAWELGSTSDFDDFLGFADDEWLVKVRQVYSPLISCSCFCLVDPFSEKCFGQASGHSQPFYFPFAAQPGCFLLRQQLSYLLNLP